jgi:hypothetical protein
VVVGGSGMLRGLCRTLAARGREVTVVGRDRSKLALATEGEPRLHPLSVDYEDVHAFRSALAAAIAERGPVALAVCWIRSWAPQALVAVADAVSPDGRLVHVLGSRGSDASLAAAAELKRRAGLGYQAVQLGSVASDGGRRWLTDEEISTGVHDAVVSGLPYSLVGDAGP